MNNEEEHIITDMNTYLEAFKKYATFTGRSRRKEYWTFALINLVISVLLSVIGSLPALASSEGAVMLFAILQALFFLVVLIPSLAVTVRRLHDSGKSGWWILIWFIPFIGVIVGLVFMLLDSQPGDNQYGPNPKGVAAPAAAVPPAAS